MVLGRRSKPDNSSIARPPAPLAKPKAGLTGTDAWRDLVAHHGRLKRRTLRDHFDRDGRRFANFSVEIDGLVADFSKNLIDAEAVQLLCRLANQQGLEAQRDAMFRGKAINTTEGRSVLHTVLRSAEGSRLVVDGNEVVEEAHKVRDRMLTFAEAVRSGERRGWTGQAFRTIVNIGIGGSDLGPAMVAQALTPDARPDLSIRYVSNVDGAHINALLADADPASTLFLVASKTFTTQETMANAASAKEWLSAAGAPESAVADHFVALSTNRDAVAAFGIDPEQAMFGFWDWVGGRYSVWSAIGLSVAISVGADVFRQFLAGAAMMDKHFQEAPLDRNIPVMMGLIGVWYSSFFRWPSRAVLPYDQHLARLPAYLQQLDMESNGKSVRLDGLPVDYDTGPIIFGEPGTNGQHAFYQLLHQGTRVIPCEFIAACRSRKALGRHHEMLLANVLAQAEALAFGKTASEAGAELRTKGLPESEVDRLTPHKVFPGNRPSTMLLFDEMTPHRLGMLLALYEHRVFVEGALWGINSFDQWGVELGKQLAGTLLPELEGTEPVTGHDGSTNGLAAYYQAQRRLGPAPLVPGADQDFNDQPEEPILLDPTALRKMAKSGGGTA